MNLPEHEKLRRELEAAAADHRNADDRRTRPMVIGVALLGLLVATVVLTVVLTGLDARGPEPPPEAQAEAAVPVQPTRRGDPRPPATSTGPDLPPEPEPAPDSVRPATHSVRPGETLAEIALRHQVPLEQIAADNDIADPDRIRAGSTLRIGPAQPGVEVITPGSTLGEYAERHGLTVAELMALNPQISDPDRIVAGAGLRVARSG